MKLTRKLLLLTLGFGLVAAPFGQKSADDDHGAAASSHAYMANFGDNTVSVIDTESYLVTSTITLPMGSLPDSVAFTAHGKFAYVTSENFPGSVFVIDTKTNMIVDTITVGVRPQPSGVARRHGRERED